MSEKGFDPVHSPLMYNSQITTTVFLNMQVATPMDARVVISGQHHQASVVGRAKAYQVSIFVWETGDFFAHVTNGSVAFNVANGSGHKPVSQYIVPFSPISWTFAVVGE